MLSIRGVSVTAGGKILQAGVSLELARGELVAVTGPSGAGKTTLLRTVVGLQDAAEGSVLLEGRSAAQWGWPLFRRKALLAAQQPVLFEATVEENLRRPFAYRSASAAPFPRERAQDLMDRLGVGADRLSQNAKTLSIGQQQRVSLIRALLLEPSVLCLDEPTSALDPDSAQRLQRLVSNEAASRGLAALVVTHNEEQAERWCHRRLALGAPGASPPESADSEVTA